MSDDELAALISAASPAGSRRGWRCPDEGQLAAWVEGGRLGAARQGAVADHLADCGHCRGQVGFLARADTLGPPPAVPVSLLAAARSGRTPPLAFLRPATLVAAGAGLVLALLVMSPWGRPGSLTEDPDAGPVVRSVRTAPGSPDSPAIVFPSEGASLSRSALELRWREAPGALYYTVQLVDPKGDVVWEGRADGTRLAIPPEAALTPGRPYFAWVLAHLRTGSTVRSPAVGFRLAPG